MPEARPPLPQAGDASLRLLRRIGAGVDPESLDAYVAAGGFAGAAPRARARRRGRAARGDANRGCSAAAAPRSRPASSGRRSREQPAQPHYVVCNADESEPGTFKDRVLMEQDPFALVEAMAIAGARDRQRHTASSTCARSIRSRTGGCRTRSTSHVAAGILDGLRDRAAHRRGRVRLRRGDGALPVDRGLPRRAAQQAAVPGRGRAVRQADRGQQRRDAVQRARGRCATAARRSPQTGTEASTGTRLFCVSGCVARPGPVRAAVRRDAARAARAGGRARRRKPCCSAAPPARSSAPTCSTCR